MADPPRIFRLRRAGQGTETHLDDLLWTEDLEPAGPPPDRGRPWVAISILQIVALSSVAYTVFRAFDFAPPYVLVVAVCAGAVLVRQAAVAVGEPRWLRTASLVRARSNGAPAEYERHDEADGMLSAVGRWTRRLDWGSRSAQRFDDTVTRRLAEIADERLRQRHGLTRDNDPGRARELLGEDLWALLYEPQTQIPSPKRLDHALRRLETL